MESTELSAIALYFFWFVLVPLSIFIFVLALALYERKIKIGVLGQPAAKHPDDPFDPIEELKKLKFYHNCGFGHIEVRTERYSEKVYFYCTGCEEISGNLDPGEIKPKLRVYFVRRAKTLHLRADSKRVMLKHLKNPPY